MSEHLSEHRLSIGNRSADLAAPRRQRNPEDIEHMLRWAYATQRVDLMLGRGLAEQEADMARVERRGSSSDGIAMIERIGQLGCRVQGSGVAMCAPVHPDAATIHDAVLSLDVPIAHLVMRHARDCTQPCWGRNIKPRFRVPLGRKGKPLVVYDASDIARNYGHCPIEWVIDQAEIETRRGVYTLWRRALMQIGIELLRVDGLIYRTPTGPLAPVAPWRTESG